MPGVVRMNYLTRRSFCTGLAGTLWAARLASTSSLAARERWRAQQGREKLIIRSIEPMVIYPPYHEYHRKTLFRYHGQNIQARTLYRVTTNLGLVGYGERWGKNSLPDTDLKQYVGTSPFDWIGHRKNLFLNMAVYDLMGKYLNLPTWKLLGPQVRNRIPVAFWTVSQTPEAMATEVRQAAKKHNETGRFAAFFGWEWSGPTGTGGDRNVNLSKELDKLESEFLKDAKVKLYRSSSHIPDFLNSMRTRKKPCTHEIIGARTSIACHLLNQTYYNHAAIKWNPKKNTFAEGGDPKWLTRDYRGERSV